MGASKALNKLRLTLEQVADAREARDALASGIVETEDATRAARRMFRTALQRIRLDIRATVPLSGTAGEIAERLRVAANSSLTALAKR